MRPTCTKILDTAVAVLLEDGFDLFSVQRVLDNAKVSRATLYRHFADVDGLIEAAIAEVQERLTEGRTTVFRDAQARGFLRPDFDARALAVMIQAIALGRIVDDAAMTHVDNVQWAESFFDLVDRGVLTPDLPD